MTWDELWELFHRAWGKAIGTPDYVKADWHRLQAILEDIERRNK